MKKRRREKGKGATSAGMEEMSCEEEKGHLHIFIFL